MNIEKSIQMFGATEWILVVLITVFLVLVLNILFQTRSEKVNERLESMEIFTKKSDEDRKLKESFTKRMYYMAHERMEIFLERYMKQGKLRPLKVKLVQAGDHVTEPLSHWAKKTLFASIAAVLSLLIFKTNILMIVVISGLAFFYPDYKLKNTIKKRQLQIKSELPDFLDLLAATAPSAKSLVDAIRQVCIRMEGEVTTEFRRTLEEINAGQKQRDALNDFSRRCGIPEIDTLVSQINQAETFGTGVERTLLVQAEKIRKMKKLLAEIKAKKASVMLLLPSLFLLITVMIMIAGPSIVQFIGAMQNF